jgi:hypothetical protein
VETIVFLDVDANHSVIPSCEVNDLLASENRLRQEPSNASHFCSIMVGFCAIVIVCAWQTFLIRHSGSNWTFLFCAGGKFTAPPQLSFEHIYQLRNSWGYDGQFYHYVAHDPFFVRGFTPYFDSARLRYGRMLMPVLAHTLALGNDRWIDCSYFAVELLSVFLGTYWLSRYSTSQCRSFVWGLGFLLVPAVLISNDRMTVDGVLASLCVAFILFADQRIDWKVYIVAMLALLTRETGGLLIAASCLWLLSHRRYEAATLFATSAIPAVLWYAFVIRHTDALTVSTPGMAHDHVPVRALIEHFIAFPFAGLVSRVLRPPSYWFTPTNQATPVLEAVHVTCNYIAAVGIALAIVLSIRLAWRRLCDARAIAIYLFAIVTSLLRIGDVNGFGRVASPLLLFLATIGICDGDVTFALPLVATALPLIGTRSLYLLSLFPGMVHP